MVEGLSKSRYRWQSTKPIVPVIYRTPISLETKVPDKPKPIDILPMPDTRSFHIEMIKLNKRIKQLKKKLSEKMDVPEIEILSLDQLQEKIMKLKETQIELHRQRKEAEDKLKGLNKTLEVRFKPRYRNQNIISQ